MSNELQILQEKFPFLSLFRYGDQELLGIIQNSGKNVTTVYVYNNIKTLEQKKRFIEMANIWWDESNRRVPINLFFKQDFHEFQPFVANFITKEFKLISGHVVSLQALNIKRTKRRRIEIHIKN